MPRVLTRCPQCAAVLTFADVTGVATLDEQHVSVGMSCHSCSLLTHMRVIAALWNTLSDEKDFVPPKVKSDDRAVPEGRRIGQTVRAFAEVELAPIYGVEDITWIWDYQEKVSPETVPVEV